VPTGELVHLQVADRVATVTLDSPANRNALSRQLVVELARQLDAAAADESVRAVQLRSAQRVFCAGADLREALATGMDEAARSIIALQRQVLALPVPVLARVDGPVRAGGLGLVAAADVVVADESATFALTEVRLGLAGATISLTVLARMTQRAAALALLGGASFDARTAEAAGLVTRTVPDDRLDAAVEAVLADLRLGSPQGLRESKALLTAPLLAAIDEHGARLAALSAALFASDEARAAMRRALDRPRDA